MFRKMLIFFFCNRERGSKNWSECWFTSKISQQLSLGSATSQELEAESQHHTLVAATPVLELSLWRPRVCISINLESGLSLGPSSQLDQMPTPLLFKLTWMSSWGFYPQTSSNSHYLWKSLTPNAINIVWRRSFRHLNFGGTHSNHSCNL